MKLHLATLYEEISLVPSGPPPAREKTFAGIAQRLTIECSVCLPVVQPPPRDVLQAVGNSRVKIVYFIRHGQSAANAERQRMQVSRVKCKRSPLRSPFARLPG